MEIEMRGANKKRRIMDQASQFSTLLGPRTRVVGTIHSRDNCIVYGQFEGDCHCDGVVILGEQGRWHGNISATKVIVSGTVTGNLEAAEQLELSASAHITGDISTPVLAMADGAVHIGGVHMERPSDVVHFHEQRSSVTTDNGATAGEKYDAS
jgi:cytoskeletal protein CcmA (bactofilin family)